MREPTVRTQERVLLSYDDALMVRSLPEVIGSADRQSGVAAELSSGLPPLDVQTYRSVRIPAGGLASAGRNSADAARRNGRMAERTIDEFVSRSLATLQPSDFRCNVTPFLSQFVAGVSPEALPPFPSKGRTE
jgi:hypothetical protein